MRGRAWVRRIERGKRERGGHVGGLCVCALRLST